MWECAHKRKEPVAAGEVADDAVGVGKNPDMAGSDYKAKKAASAKAVHTT